MRDSLPVIVLGAGGHAKVLVDILLRLSVNVIGLCDCDPGMEGHSIMDVPVIGNDDKVLEYSMDEIRLVNGLGSVGLTKNRRELYGFFKNKGYSFATIIHPSALIASEVDLSEGVQVFAGVIIQPGTVIGQDTIINTGSSIDHDCIIGDHVFIAPGVTLSGEVEVGSNTHVGTGVNVIQGVRIGEDSLIAAGSLVIRDVPDAVKVMGVPAQIIEE